MHMDEYAPDKPGAFLIYPRNIPEGYDRRRPLNRDSSGWQQNRQYPIEIYVNVPVYRVTDTPEEQTANQTSVVDSNEISESYNANNIPEQRIRQADEEGLTTNKRGRMSVRSKRILFSTIVSMVIIIIIIIVIAVPLSLRKPSTDRFSKIKAVVQSISSKNDLKNSSSPQSRALHWLVYEDGLNVSDTDFVWLRQRYTMAVLYYSTGGETWTNSLHFLESIHECDWRNESVADMELDMPFPEGLSCSSTKIVIAIDLDKSNLTGTIPGELGYTTKLQNIKMSLNPFLEGTVPSSFIMLTELEDVSIRKTNISGTFPSLRAPNMKNLVLSLNRLVGTIPSLTHLSSLTNLDVTYNSLSGNIPDLPLSLTDLDLSYNKIIGRISSSIQSLTSLKTCLLHSNHLTGTLPSFRHCTNLTALSVIGNFLTGTISPQIWELPQLYLLGLGSNSFGGSLNGIGAAKFLQGLSIDRNQFTGSIPSDIGSMTSLFALFIDRNQLSGSLPEQIGLLKNLMFLSLGDNLFTGTIPISFNNLTNLVFLSIAECRFEGNLDQFCSSIAPNHPYIAADCKDGQFCPPGCCTTCCDVPSVYNQVCRNGYQYYDPLLLTYTLYDRHNKNISWL